MAIAGFRPAPGPQMANKYPFTGPNYQRLGEQKGWIYNPYTDKYVPDPNVQRQLQEQAGLGEPKPPGLGETLLPIAGVGLAIEGGRQLGKEGISGLLSIGDKSAPVGGIDVPAATSGSAPLPATGANQPSGLLGIDGGASSGASEVYQVGTNADGSMLMSDGSTQFANGLGEWGQAPGTFGQVLGGAAAAKGAYDTYNAFQKNGEGIRNGTTQMGAGIGTMVAGPIGAAGGALIGNAIGYGLQGKGIKNDLALLGATGGMAAPYVLARRLGWDGMHKSTRQEAQEKTKGLLGIGKDDKAYQDYVMGMREQYNSAPVDPSKPFAGKYSSFDEYKKGGLEASDLTGVYGNIKVYGPEWAKLTQEQRQAITQENINSDIYDSSKGDVYITDEAKAKENRDKVLGVNPQVKGAAPTGQAPAIPPGKNLRSSTSSPGFDKNGKRISYGLLGVR